MSLMGDPAATEHVAGLIQKLQAVAQQHERGDLCGRLDVLRTRLTDTEVRVVVVGQFKQGKSALVNALVAAPVCPVDDIVATSVPTVVRWGESTRAELVTDFAEQQEVLHTDIDVRNLRQHVTEIAGETGIAGNLRAEVTLVQPLLAGGLVLVDTPGFGRAQVRASTNLTLLPQADISVMVSDATQEFTAAELSFLKNAVELCPRIVCVLSKIDLQYQWREIVRANRDHLDKANLSIDIRETSAVLHDLGLHEGDHSLRQDARIDALASHLHDEMAGEVLASRLKAVADDINGVGQHLILAINAELQALRHPETSGEVLVGIANSELAATELAQRSARWQQTLSDGASELVSDIEFDLRDRLREVGRHAEQLIDASDPGQSWESTGAWLAESITQAVSDNFVWAHQRSVHLAEVVAQHFLVDERVALPQLTTSDSERMLEAIGGLEMVRDGKLTLGQKLMIGLKGSYGGVLMFGLMTTLAGMALVNPISLAAGLIMGGFAYRQDAQQRVEQRRLEAKASVRKLIDEAIFQVSKESRDRIGRIKRTLRDHFTDIAEDLKRSLAQSRRAAQHATTLPITDQQLRLERLTRDLAEVQHLSALATQFSQAATTPERITV